MKNLQLPKAPEIKYFESAEYKLKIEKARQKMRAKPFTERFKNIQLLARVGTFFFPAISVLTGITFLYNYIYGATAWFFFSVAVSFIILSFIELAKNSLINNGLDTYFSNSGKSTVVFIFAGLFSIGSFIMSYQGAELLVKNLDNSKQTITKNITGKENDIEKNYNRLIASEKQKIAAINKKAKNQWNGMLTPEQSKRIEIYERNIQKYIDLKEKYKDRLLDEKESKIDAAIQKTLHNAYIFKVIAAINELLTVLSIAFLVFYDFKTVQQDIFLNEFLQNPDKYKDIEKKQAFFPVAANNEIPEPHSPPLNDVSLNMTSERKIVKGFFRDIENKPIDHVERITMTVKKTRICKHCGKEFEYKHWNKQYCSDECRIEHWEKTTGKKLNFKKVAQ